LESAVRESAVRTLRRLGVGTHCGALSAESDVDQRCVARSVSEQDQRLAAAALMAYPVAGEAPSVPVGERARSAAMNASGWFQHQVGCA